MANVEKSKFPPDKDHKRILNLWTETVWLGKEDITIEMGSPKTSYQYVIVKLKKLPRYMQAMDLLKKIYLKHSNLNERTCELYASEIAGALVRRRLIEK
ncbi:hypothetical protein [Streptococcus danieliae]|uniref:hypothetical protein n=1 Tax=Streptococcus danieliae TaxID=747656 RepID=UPI0021CA3BA3|nr:hypothetical protein [Streptococcus danieliae]MCU0082460.1 hypothetical protein [Streptococcus danieliae]